jgi:hypothetical protein
MLKQENSPKSTRLKICPTCKKPFTPSSRGKRGQAQIHCSKKCQKNGEHKTVTKNCLQCGALFTFRSTGKKNNNKRRFCGNVCAAKWHNAQPDRIAKMEEYFPRMRAAAQAVLRGKPSPSASLRMNTNNPNQTPEWKAKMSKIMSGRTFLARGGNGTLTHQQLAVAKALGLPMEYPISTKLVMDQFKSLPTCYKVDIADPGKMLAIEIDGATHRTKKWQFLDRRKTEVLNALGWSVLRFSNQRVDSDLVGVLKEIREFTVSK